MLPVLLICFALLALLPASAAADGLPAVGIDARPLGLAGGDVTYTTRSGEDATVLIERAASAVRCASGGCATPSRFPP